MNMRDHELVAPFRSGYRENTQTIKRMKRKQRFGKHGKYQAQRVIEGFYYYLHPEEVGDRSQGWRMFARDGVKPLWQLLLEKRGEALDDIERWLRYNDPKMLHHHIVNVLRPACATIMASKEKADRRDRHEDH